MPYPNNDSFVDFDDDAAVLAALAEGGDHDVRADETDECMTIAVARAYKTDPRLFQPLTKPMPSQRPPKSCPSLRDLPPRPADMHRGASANAAAAASGCAPRDPASSDNSCAVYVVHDFDTANKTPGEADRKAVIDALRSSESARSARSAVERAVAGAEALLEDMDETPAQATRKSATPAALARARARGALSRARPARRGVYQNPSPKKHPSELDRSTVPKSNRVCPGDMPALPLRSAPSKIDPSAITQKAAALRGSAEAPPKMPGNGGAWRRVVQVAIDHSKAIRTGAP